MRARLFAALAAAFIPCLAFADAPADPPELMKKIIVTLEVYTAPMHRLSGPELPELKEEDRMSACTSAARMQGVLETYHLAVDSRAIPVLPDPNHDARLARAMKSIDLQVGRVMAPCERPEDKERLLSQLRSSTPMIKEELKNAQRALVDSSAIF